MSLAFENFKTGYHNNLIPSINDKIIKDPAKTYMIMHITNITTNNGADNYDGKNVYINVLANGKVDWGDGDVTSSESATQLSHSYTKVGYYLITVTNVGSFNFCNKLSSDLRLIKIAIGNTVTSMGSSAFKSCENLTSITIGNSVVSIGDYAFTYCYGLTSIVIPDSVTSIGDYAFFACNRLTNIVIPNSVTSIEDLAFCNCHKLTSIIIPDSVTSIGYAIFMDCTKLESVTVGKNMENIEDSFSTCYNLKSFTINTITPPTLAAYAIPSSIQKIIVPKESLQAYKTATNWNTLADKICYEIDNRDLSEAVNLKNGLDIDAEKPSAAPTSVRQVNAGYNETQGTDGFVPTDPKNFGTNSAAFGHYTMATGDNAFATGSRNIAKGATSFSANNKTKAIGDSSFASGQETYAVGLNCHAEGYSTIAGADTKTETASAINAAHAEGNGTKATKDYSHAEGHFSQALAVGAHSEGHTAIAGGAYSHAEGNAQTGTGGKYAHAEGNDTTASAESAHAEGNSTEASGINSHAEGKTSKATQDGAHAEGYSNATAIYAHAENWSNASGQYSHSEGVNTNATNYAAHAEGQETAASGEYSHSEGYGTEAKGNGSHAEGAGSVATGNNAHAEGNNTEAVGVNSHAQGLGTVAYSGTNKPQHVVGAYNVKDTSANYAVIVGNGTGAADSTRSNAATLDWSGNLDIKGEYRVNGQKLNVGELSPTAAFTFTTSSWTKSSGSEYYMIFAYSGGVAKFTSESLDFTTQVFEKIGESTGDGVFEAVNCKIVVQKDKDMKHAKVTIYSATMFNGKVIMTSGLRGAQGPAGPSYTLPKASSSTLGGIKVGTGLSMGSDGTLSATGGGGSSWYLHEVRCDVDYTPYQIGIISQDKTPYTNLYDFASSSPGEYYMMPRVSNHGMTTLSIRYHYNQPEDADEMYINILWDNPDNASISTMVVPYETACSDVVSSI